MMTHEQFQEQLRNIPDVELVDKAEKLLTSLCSTGAKSFTMTVPPRLDDSDMILSELIRRFKSKQNEAQQNEG